MITVLWKPPEIAECDWQAYRGCWTKINGGFVVERPDTPFARQQAWDCLARDERIVWCMPHFIPSTSFLDELDYCQKEGYEILTLRMFEAVFPPHGIRPALWTPTEDVSRALVVFQLKKLNLPSAKVVDDFWAWLGRGRPRVAHHGQTWADDTARSTLGTVYPHMWGPGELGLSGPVISGGTHWWDRGEMLKRWRQAVEGWSCWLRKHE
ncbi:MAG: hypothetical protein WC683_07235 [bacterium]